MRHSWVLLTLALLLLAHCDITGAGYLALPLHTRDVAGGRDSGSSEWRRRLLLRNATLPLHGAVKQLG
jgi:hypothetical protein